MGIKGFNQSGPSFINKFGRAASGDSTGLDAANTAPDGSVTPMAATGGVISDYTEPGGNIYRAHIFTASGTFTVTEVGEGGPTSDAVEYLVIAGGGGGGAEGSQRGGGGGAGGYRTNVPTPIGPGNHTTTNPFPVAVGSYNIIIGAGGGGGHSAGGSDGGDSQLGPPSLAERIISNGGGGGGQGSQDSPPANEGRPGGSGGGGGSTASPSATEPGGSTLAVTTPSPWPGPSTQGFAGGNGQHVSGSWAAGGGGGGAGEAGKAGANPNTNSSHGGDGLSNLIAGPTNTGVGVANPTSPGRWFAGGGAGIHFSPGTGTGGAGGGASTNYPGNGGRGVDGTGGGGSSGAQGGQGGSGIIIVRYQIGSVSDAKATGGNISFHGGKTIHTFLSSGSFIVASSEIPSAEVVVVAGGGGGAGFGGQGWGGSGGGGAGGMLVHPGRPFAASTTYPIAVGSGGVGGQGPGINNGRRGTDGTNSVLTDPSSPGTITGNGGGGGGCQSNDVPSDGRNGGSGGGGAGGGNPPAGSGGTANQGNSGGATGYGYNGASGVGAPTYQGAGGGGAGTGGSGSTGNGGYGRQLPTSFRDPDSTVGDPGTYGDGTAPTPGGFWVAGGGGCGDPNYPGTGGTGGSGGGGKGTGPWTTSPATQPYVENIMGKVNTGGGGGGMNAQARSPLYVGNGGSGIILIAYPTT